MKTITLISTVHKEMGRCNADELCEILEGITPDVIFVEALDETYSHYEKSLVSFGVYHKKLEIKAIQKYSKTTAKYVPVLDRELSQPFYKKYNVVCENEELQRLIDNLNSLAAEYGFSFLNSAESITLHDEMRQLESSLLNSNELDQAANEAIDAYENSMLERIYSYCRENEFNRAVFMCGSAHRKSIIKKLERFKAQETGDVSWIVFQG